jgi:hypothetical protein
MSTQPYPRAHWRAVVALVAAVFGILFLVGFGIWTIVTAIQVADSQRTTNQANASNHFWRSVAGLEPIDGSTRLGQLALVVREQKAQANPIAAFRSYYFVPDKWGGMSGELGTVVAANYPGGRGEVQDEGHFTADFILDALQAEPSTLQSLMKPVPPVKPYGLATWQNLVLGVGGICALDLLAWLLLRLDQGVYNRVQFARQRRQAKAKREAEYAALPNDFARDAWRLVQEIEQHPGANKKMLRDAKALLARCKQGLGGAEARRNPKSLAAGDSVSDLQNQLTDLREGWRAANEAYNRMRDR